MLADAARAAARAADRAGVEIRPLESLTQMQAACDVLTMVWDIRPPATVDVQPHLLRALGHGGNYLVGAYRSGSTEMVGASVAFFIEPLGAAMHSHITGVLGAGRGVGAALKWHQRQWALERGLGRITWTFDPLVARNSFFNLTRLGARPESYFVDFYGPLDDGPNRGQPTDRAEVVWDLTSTSALEAERAARDGVSRAAGFDVDGLLRSGIPVRLRVGPDGEPALGPPPAVDDVAVLVGIPADIEAMRRTDPGSALAWRTQLRTALTSLMAGTAWQVTGFARSGWYLLERRKPA
jgi:predicted GNAT superfamily acetyltransferase